MAFKATDLINKNSRLEDEEPKAKFRIRDISIHKMYPNSMNFYDVSGIEELANDILVYGLKQNLEVKYEPCSQGEYKIVAGERRWRALQHLTSKGYKEFEIATCKLTSPKDADEEQIEIIIANSYRTKTVKDIIEEEQKLKIALENMRAAGKKIKGYDLNTGRLRDTISGILNVSKTKIAQIESISKNIIPEFREELDCGRLTFSAAYELSGMPAERQRELFLIYKDNGELTHKEIKSVKENDVAAEEQQLKGQYSFNEQMEVSEYDTITEEERGQQQEEYESPNPKSIVSLCWSCKKYVECNVKTSTCTECNQYVNKAEAEKTEEQRYNEEQKRIDRETSKKLKEQEDKEKMDNLPRDKPKDRKYIRVSVDTCEMILKGIQRYLIVKDSKYKTGDLLTLEEYKEGKPTGRTHVTEIIHMDNNSTSSVIQEGYCVLGIK